VETAIAMIETVQEHLDTRVGPAPQTPGESRTGNDWRISPVVWNDQHCDTIADVRPKEIQQLVDLALETRRDVVN
jgi:hypothetical protein